MKKLLKKLYIAVAVALTLPFILLPFGKVSFACAEEATEETDEESASTEAASEEKTVIVGYFDDDATGFLSGFSESDRKSGYAYEYIQDIADITGWKYEYVYGTWDELYQKLLKGEIDMMPGVAYDFNKGFKIVYTSYAMMNLEYHIYAYADSGLDIYDTETLNHKMIAVEKDTARYDDLRSFISLNGVDCSIVVFNTEAECRKAAEAGKVDGFVAATIHEHEGFEAYFELADDVVMDGPQAYVAFSLGNDELAEEFDEAQRVIYERTPNYNYLLEDKYFRKVSVSTTLTADEKKWLHNKIFLTVGVTKDDLPLSGIDDDKKAIGLAGTLIEEMEYYLGIPVRAKFFDSTAELEQAVLGNVVDLAFPMFYDKWYAEQEGYLISDTVFTENAVRIYKGEYDDSNTNTVAVSTSSVCNRFLVSIYYPDTVQKVYSSRAGYLSAVMKGEADFTIGSSYVLSRFLEANEEYSSLNKIIDPNIELGYGFAVNHENYELVSIVNKFIRSLDDSVVPNALIKYSIVKNKTTFAKYVKENIPTVLLSVAVFILAVTASVLWVRQKLLIHKKTIEKQEKKLDETKADLKEALQNEIKVKTELAQALTDQNVIYSELLRMESGAVVAIDWDTHKLITVNEAALHLFGLASESEALGRDYNVIFDCVSEDVREEIRKEAVDRLKERSECSFEVPVVVDKKLKYLLQQAVLITLGTGMKVCLISLTDITDSKMLEMELQTASRIDALSGVNNRGWGEKLINEAIESGLGGMFCLLDINKFKSINDTYGHQCGDIAIKTVAGILRDSFRDQDIVMRLGGDEFAAFATGVKSKEEGAAIISRFFARLKREGIPEMDGKVINVALGACICLGSDITFDDMYRMADSQMYKCKEKPESSFIFY